jgi:hypothetical protein
LNKTREDLLKQLAELMKYAGLTPADLEHKKEH